MPVYNFKRDVKFYLVSGNLRWKIEIYPDIGFSQTFNEQANNVKTLHAPENYFETATIIKANPANFNFTIPLTLGGEVGIILDWLLQSTAAARAGYDIYVDTGNEVFRIEKCVIETGTFQIVRDAVVTLSCEGTGSRLTRHTAAIPGVLQARGPATDFLVPKFNWVQIGGITQPYITSISFELKNEVQWIENTTLHKSLLVKSASDTVYPEAFVVTKKILSGTIQQYLTDETRANIQTWSTGSSVRVRVASVINTYKLDFNLPSVVFTNRIDPSQEVFVQSYDFRMNTNPTNLGTVVVVT